MPYGHGQGSAMNNFKKGSQGFSLVELLVALAIAGLTFSAIYSLFFTQSKGYTTQSQVVDLQRSLRAGSSAMARDLRSAAYNPGGLTGAAASSDGIDNDCDGTTDEADNVATLLVDESEVIGFQVALANTVTFALDANGDGTACGNQERITYALNGTELVRNGLPKSANIEVLNFVYLDEEGAVATSIDDIRAVQIAIVGRTKNEDPAYTNSNAYVNLQGDEILAAQNDGFRRRLLTSQVYCRNLYD